MNVLVLDIGGTNVKARCGGQGQVTRFRTGPAYGPRDLVRDLEAASGAWDYGAVTIGFPAPVVEGRLPTEPQNLGPGWVGFDFAAALGRPVRLINDAAMQAVGCYRGGRLLFLSIGTGLGSALVVDHQVIGLELCELRWAREVTLEERLRKAACKERGRSRWERSLHEAVELLRRAFLPDDIVIGGGGAKQVKRLPDGCRRGSNLDAMEGGEILWRDPRFRIC